MRVNQTSTTKQTFRLTRVPYRETMRQTTPTLPISPKMLRHFAVLTMAITSVLGIFAQGESAKVETGTHNGTPPESSGSSFEFGGAEKAALAGGNKSPGEVGGLQIARGTQLQADGGSGEGSSSSGGEGVGSVQMAPPAAPRRIVPGLGGKPPVDAATQPSGLPPMPQDGHGVPAPGLTAPGISGASGLKPQAPRKPTAEDIKRVMAASGQRSGNAPQ